MRLQRIFGSVLSFRKYFALKRSLFRIFADKESPMFLYRMSAIAAIFVCVFMCGVFAASAAPRPEESIAMLQKAIDSRDMELAEKYLDVDGIVRSGVDMALQDKAVLRELQKYPAAAVLLALGGSSGGGEALRGLLSAEVREYVRHGVVSGAFAGKPQEGASVYNGILGKPFKGGAKDKKAFGPVSVKKKDASSALLAASLMQGAKKRTYPLELVAKKQEGVWRIVQLANMGELFGLGGAEEQ